MTDLDLAPPTLRPCRGGCGRLSAWMCDDCHQTALAARKATEAGEKLSAALVGSGLPLRYRMGEATLESYKPATEKQKRAVHVCLQVLALEITSSLLITGPKGVGKTHLAAATLAQWLKLLRTGRFTTMQDALIHVRSTYGGGFDAETEEAAVAGYRSPRLLVLDDLGVEKATEAAVGTLYAILNHRLEERRPTILTSNYGPKELAERLSTGTDDLVAARIMDRLRGGWVVEMDGKSQRGHK